MVDKLRLRLLPSLSLMGVAESEYEWTIFEMTIALLIQMRYNIISLGVGARHCRAPTGVPH
jgi:hypothetical protein